MSGIDKITQKLQLIIEFNTRSTGSVNTVKMKSMTRNEEEKHQIQNSNNNSHETAASYFRYKRDELYDDVDETSRLINSIKMKLYR